METQIEPWAPRYDKYSIALGIDDVMSTPRKVGQPRPTKSLRNGLVWGPQMRDLRDPIAELSGTPTGTTYNRPEDARDFNGTTDIVSWPSVLIPTAFSFSTWIKLDAYGSGHHIWVIESSTSGTWGMRFIITSGGIQRLFFEIDYSTTNLVRMSNSATPLTLDDGDWHQLVVTHPGTDVAADTHLFYDGDELTYSTTTNGVGAIVALDEEWSLGNDIGGILGVDGLLASEFTWDRAITPAEVRSLFLSSRYRA